MGQQGSHQLPAMKFTDFFLTFPEQVPIFIDFCGMKI